MWKNRALVVLASLAAVAAPAVSGAAEPDPGPSGSYIVALRSGDPAGVAAEHARGHGAEVDLVFRHAVRGYAARMSAAAAHRVGQDERVAFVVPDRQVSVDVQTLPTGIDRIDGELSSTISGDGGGAVDVDVAVLDTGVAAHPDLNVAGGVNCTPGQSNEFGDKLGHGTHVAGTIGALDNDFGVVGVVPGARMWSIKVLGNGGIGATSWVICGIEFVTAHANLFEVANMSLGGPGSDDQNCGRTNNDPMHLAICNSVAAGVTYAVAAGNASDDAANYTPAAYDEVITVSALADFDGRAGGLGAPTCRNDEDDSLANFSNFGSDIDLIAPGACILSTVPTTGQLGSSTGYGTLSGTSMAAPHVAGAAALYKSTHRSARPARVKAALQAAGTLDWNDVDDPDPIKERLLDVDPF